jgi:hypothetical protein
MLPNSRIVSALRLSDRLSSGGGTAGTVPQIDRVDLLGAAGTALTDLRPAGVARIGTDRVDVVSEGDYISVGTRLTVLRVEGSRVTVRPLEGEPAPANSSSDTATSAESDQKAADDGRKEA